MAWKPVSWDKYHCLRTSDSHASLNMVTFVFVMIMIAEASTDRIVEVLDEVPEMEDKADAERMWQMVPLTFNHVDFSYAGEGGNLP